MKYDSGCFSALLAATTPVERSNVPYAYDKQ
jgi:hypothetical protein